MLQCDCHMRANIRQVAERANVSRMTVSRVLQNRRSELTDETYERVVTALRELNYVPVRTAVQNHHTRTNVVGVVPYSSNMLGYNIDVQTLCGISFRGYQLGYDILLLQRGESEWMLNRKDLRFLDRRTDGFIFISPCSSEWRDVLPNLTEQGVPVVVCYRRDVPDGVAWVDPDNDRIVRIAVDVLVAQGHKAITYFSLPERAPRQNHMLADLSGPLASYDDGQRYLLFNEELRKLGGIPTVLRSNGSWNSLVTQADLDTILQSGATAVICFCAELGVQLLARLRERGMDTPRDLSIVNFDWSTESSIRGLAHVTFRYDSLGQYAMDAWKGLIDGKIASECCKVVPVEFVDGMSVGAPRPQS